jgi:hypothetical protein
MKSAEIIVHNVDNEDEVEELLSKKDSGLVLDLTGQLDRNQRHSLLHDAIAVAGDVASIAALIKTVLDIMGLPPKRPGGPISLKFKNRATGREVELKTRDRKIVADALQTLFAE